MNAVYEKERMYTWRFFIAVGVLAGSAILVGRYIDIPWVQDWFPLVVAGLFYLYLLWEINGPLYRAAERHFKALQAESSPMTHDSSLERTREG